MSKATVLETIGDAPHNQYHLEPLMGFGEDIPAGGFDGAMGRTALVSQLKETLCAWLVARYTQPYDGKAKSLEVDDIDFSHDGATLQNDKTLNQNGIPDQGAAARKNGAKIKIIFSVKEGVELPAAFSKRLSAEADAKAADIAAKNAEDERQAQIRAAQAEADRKQKEEAAAAAAAAEAAAAAKDRMTIRYAPLGEPGGGLLETSGNVTVSALAEAIMRAVGVHHDGGIRLLDVAGNMLEGNATLRHANIADGAEIQYFFV